MFSGTVTFNSENANIVKNDSEPGRFTRIRAQPIYIDKGKGRLSLHADDLTEGVDDLNQIALSRHHFVDGLVGSRGLVQNATILSALDSFRRLFVILKGKGLASFGP